MSNFFQRWLDFISATPIPWRKSPFDQNWKLASLFGLFTFKWFFVSIVKKKSNLLFLCILWETEALDGRNFDFQVPKWPKNSRQQSSEMFFGSVFWICLVIIQEVCDSWPMLRTTYLIILQGKQGSQIELFPIHSKVQMGYKPIIFTLLCTLLSGHFILQESKKMTKLEF